LIATFLLDKSWRLRLSFTHHTILNEAPVIYLLFLVYGSNIKGKKKSALKFIEIKNEIKIYKKKKSFSIPILVRFMKTLSWQSVRDFRLDGVDNESVCEDKDGKG
jgi:hypothetical protein